VTLSKREKSIAAVVAGIVLLYIGYAFAVSPYIQKRDALSNAIEKAAAREKRDDDLLSNQPRVKSEWTKLTSTTLKTDAAQATSRVNDALQDWARSSRFTIQALKPERPVQQKDFQHIRFQVSGEGNSEQVARFLYTLETTDLPLKIDDLRINTRKEGVNYLAVELKVTTLVFSPSTTTRPGARTAAPKGDSL
jgi:Tfp pilus assembly protein PilO